MPQVLGIITAGSLTEGLTMRVSPETELESLKTGKFVAVTGTDYTFFSLITDLQLQITHPDIMLYPPTEKESLLLNLLRKKSIFATAQLRPMIMLDKNDNLSAVKTLPPHFAQVREAQKEDIAKIFGSDTDPSQKYFTIGYPLDMDTPVCIDLEKLTERSSGIFGKTGTGKTFLTRLVLAGLLHTRKAVTLIFDMHSEYGLQARKEGDGQMFVKGLKTLFPDRVAIFSLDPVSTRRRAGAPDVELILYYQDIKIEDIISLQQELNLHSTALEAAYLIAARYKQHWLQTLLEQTDFKEFANSLGAHTESIAALYRKLKRIERLPFIVPVPPIYNSSNHNSAIDSMMEYLTKGISICVEFGNFTSSFCYLLVSNIVTRRIHSEYIEKTEKFLGSQKKEDEPTKLIITIEEAHKFLNPTTAKQTIFGTIAREMRKYYVSLLVVDQRPSGIDPDVCSQLGTKIVAQLSDEHDIQAVLTGTHNASTLRSVLATLDTKKQILVLGHAITMPVVVQTRNYDSTFYRDMTINKSALIKTLVKELY